MCELNDGQGADIDQALVPMVKFLNRMGCSTFSCCQGEPGVIGEGGQRGHVYFNIPNRTPQYQPVADFTFNFLWPFVEHLWDDVMVSIHLSGDWHFWGEMSFRNEAIEEITKHFGNWCEMNHK